MFYWCKRRLNLALPPNLATNLGSGTVPTPTLYKRDCSPILHEGVNGTVSSSGIVLTLSGFINHLVPVAAMIDFIMAMLGQITPILLLVDHFGPICDTIKSTVTATGIWKKLSTLKVNRILEQ